MDLGQIKYAPGSIVTVIRESLRMESIVEHSRVDMDIENAPFIFNVYVTLNTYEQALEHCKSLQIIVYDALIHMFDFKNIKVHIHFENLNTSS